MTDISFQGSLLTIAIPGGNGPTGNIIHDFGDEGSPVEFGNNETFGFSGNMNGTMLTWSRYRPVEFDVSVIPNSQTDKILRGLWLASHLGQRPEGVTQTEVTITSCTLRVPNITTTSEGTVNAGGNTVMSYGPGKMTQGSPGFGANAEGKMSMRRYHFVMEKVIENK